MCDIQVEVTVAVGIEEAGAGAPAGIRDAGPFGHLLESAIPPVPVEPIRPEIGDIKIDMPVVVLIAGETPQPQLSSATPARQDTAVTSSQRSVIRREQGRWKDYAGKPGRAPHGNTCTHETLAQNAALNPLGLPHGHPIPPGREDGISGNHDVGAREDGHPADHDDACGVRLNWNNLDGEPILERVAAHGGKKERIGKMRRVRVIVPFVGGDRDDRPGRTVARGDDGYRPQVASFAVPRRTPTVGIV